MLAAVEAVGEAVAVAVVALTSPGSLNQIRNIDRSSKFMACTCTVIKLLFSLRNQVAETSLEMAAVYNNY